MAKIIHIVLNYGTYRMLVYALMLVERHSGRIVHFAIKA